MKSASSVSRLSDRIWRGAAAAVLVAALAAVACAAGSAAELLNMPVPTEFVTDKAEIIDADSASTLNAVLSELETKTTVQFLVVTIDTTGGKPIADVAKALGNKWQLGQKGKDNGILLLVALKDHDIRIAVGKGLEKVLSASACDSIAANDMTPLFRKKEYGKGVVKGTLAVVAKLEKLYNVRLTTVPGRGGVESTGAASTEPSPETDSGTETASQESPPPAAEPLSYPAEQPTYSPPYAPRGVSGFSSRPDWLGGLPCGVCTIPFIILAVILSNFMRGGNNFWYNNHGSSWGGFGGGGGGSFGGGGGGGSFGGGFGGGGGGSFGGGGGGAHW
jgi:uncharacterized protein